LPDGFIAFDSELRFRFVNPAAEQMLGRTFADIEGVDLLTAFPNSFGYAYYERVLANQEIVTFEMYFEAVGQWIEAQAIPVERGVSVLLRDITTRRMANLMLRSSDEWFRALSEYGSDITILLDDEAKIRYVSQSVQRVLGFPPSALNGQPFFDRIHEEDVQLVTEALQALQASTPIIEGLVYRARHASGEWRFIESTISNQLGNSSVAGLVLHARDVKERIRLQDQLVHSGKLAALGELVAGVAHEINNPLAAISGFAQLLASHPDPQVGQDALAIRNMVDRASKIVHSLRGFARPSNSELEHKASDLNAVVGSALEIAGSTLKHAQVDVGLHLEANLPAVLMNQSEMEQVVVNLLTNAVSAVRDREPRERRVVVRTFSHRVQVSAGRLQTNVSLIVSDNGIGMEPSMARRIFEPFFTSKDRGEGTGLGLYISYGIVSSHGGTLDVITSPGAGATLTVTLPAAKGD
jgi:two-component system NtrC family sensor kinase